jgi:hypothetical protein
MNSNQEFSFIDECLSPNDALEILINLYNSKIQFLEIKRFSSKIRYGIENESDKKKIIQLRENLQNITNLLKNSNFTKIEIKSIVNISLKS